MNDGLEASDPRVKALQSLKEWSNYLLVTTVAATGWLAKTSEISASPRAGAALWCLAVSAAFGILTLALVPLISEQLNTGDNARSRSIYKVRASFHLFGLPGWAYLTMACRPQHVLFMFGVLLYAAAAVPIVPVGAWIALGAVVLSALSVPRNRDA